MDITGIFSPSMLVTASFIALVAMVLWVRISIALILAGLGLVGVLLLEGVSSARTLLGTELWGTFSSYGMTVVPLFLLMGQLCFHAGLNERLYRALHTLVGHAPGGLAAATILACGGFSAICGSNTATAATMAGVALPEMRRYGYNGAFAAGTVAVGATLGVVIPPSVVLILIGIQTGLSVSDLFMASIIPGVGLIAALTGCAAMTARAHPSWAPRGLKAPLRERLCALPRLGEALILWSIVLGGMFTGLVTPTEAGGLGAIVALVMGIAGQHLNLQKILAAIADTLRLTSMILLLVAGAMIYGKFLAISQLPFALAEGVRMLQLPPVLVIALILLIYFLGGMLMDALALLLITVPVFFPLAQSLHIDLLSFSVLVTVITTVGAVTPPVGVCSYVVASFAPDIPLASVFKGSLPYLPAYGLVILGLLLLCSM